MLVTLAIAGVLTLIALMTVYTHGLREGLAFLFIGIEIFLLVLMAGASLIFLGPTLLSGALFVAVFVLATVLIAVIFRFAFRWSLLQWLKSMQ